MKKKSDLYIGQLSILMCSNDICIGQREISIDLCWSKGDRICLSEICIGPTKICIGPGKICTGLRMICIEDVTCLSIYLSEYSSRHYYWRYQYYHLYSSFNNNIWSLYRPISCAILYKYYFNLSFSIISYLLS